MQPIASAAPRAHRVARGAIAVVVVTT